MSNQGAEMITLCAVGDVRITHNEPEFMFEFVRPTISDADIAFCQLETAYSNKGSKQPQVRIAFRASPEGAPGLKDAGFDVVSLAGNHCMDYGHDALLDTIDILRANGLLTLGTGGNIEEAGKPAIVERNGTRVGFLAYNSVMAEGSWAQSDRPGVNPIRIYTRDGQFNSGETAAARRSDTFAGREDVEAMVRSIKKLKAEADIAIVSLHWGLPFSPADLAGYQMELGHAVIDAGADLVLGHHPHILKAIEVYKGKVIFYSIGNFAFDHSTPLSAAAQALHPGYKEDPEYAGYRFPADSRKTVVVKCLISGKKLQSVSVLPVYINGRAQPQILRRDDKRFDEVVDYLKKVTTHHGLPANYTIEGAEAIIWS